MQMWFSGINGFIILWAVATGILFGWTLVICKKMKNQLKPVERRANPKQKKAFTQQDMHELEDIVVKEREKINLLYAFYANFVTIFPLLGMLGTVFSLIGVAGNMQDTSADVQQFFGALTSTALGIMFAILFKALDSVISVQVTENNHEVETLLKRNSHEQRERKLYHEG